VTVSGLQVCGKLSCSYQWRSYTTARQVKWRRWEIYRPGSALLIALLLIVWTENKSVTISDAVFCFILTVKHSAAWAACVLRATTKQGVNMSSNFFEEKSAPQRKSWLRRRLRVTWLEDFLTSKWPGCFTALARHWQVPK